MWNWYKSDMDLEMSCGTIVLLYDAHNNKMQMAEMIAGWFYEYPAATDIDGKSMVQNSVHNDYQFWRYLPDPPM